MINRRELLTGSLAALPLWARQRIGRNRIAAITDEIARTPAGAIAFAQQYGLKWLELRSVPTEQRNGPEYAFLPEADARAAAREIREAGLKVSFLNTGLLKFAMPGTEYVRQRAETPEVREKRRARDQARYDRHRDDLRHAIRTAHLFDVRFVRVFTFLRVAEPQTMEQRVLDILGEMAGIAGKDGIRLLVENEVSCNVASCAELASLLQRLPEKTVGINWDPMNGMSMNETPYPAGYELLPRKRVWNVQVKGRTILDYPERLDWSSILQALERDGYRGQVGLETHIFGPQLIEMSHQSMKEILRLVEPS